MFQRIAQPFYTAWAILVFSIGLLIVFPLTLVLSIGNNVAARRAIYAVIKAWATGWLWLVGMPLRIIGQRPPAGRYIVVANHISYLDTVNVFPAVPGYFRALGKKEMSRIPLFGFLYRQIVIMVDRSSQHSRSKSMKLMWRVLHREANIFIFPEGTFNETKGQLKDFYDGAFKLAINTQTDIFPIVFPDTVTRWHYSVWWKIWPGQNRAIYLVPVPVKGMTIDQLPQLKQKVYSLMEQALLDSKA